MNVPMPSWNFRGVLDPVNHISPTSADRAPYRVSLIDFVESFATSGSRIQILLGLLDYRAALHNLGIVDGFQWLDGSFLEHVELLEHRDPNDLDVVTFYEMPQGQTQRSLFASNPSIFPQNSSEQEALKKSFRVDAYMQVLSTRPEQLISRATYWYSMWSHRRDLTWKGFVEIELSPAEDQDTREAIKTLLTNDPNIKSVRTGEES
jgi:hypothetical protein